MNCHVVCMLNLYVVFLIERSGSRSSNSTCLTKVYRFIFIFYWDISNKKKKGIFCTYSVTCVTQLYVTPLGTAALRTWLSLRRRLWPLTGSCHSRISRMTSRRITPPSCAPWDSRPPPTPDWRDAERRPAPSAAPASTWTLLRFQSDLSHGCFVRELRSVPLIITQRISVNTYHTYCSVLHKAIKRLCTASELQYKRCTFWKNASFWIRIGVLIHLGPHT